MVGSRRVRKAGKSNAIPPEASQSQASTRSKRCADLPGTLDLAPLAAPTAQGKNTHQ